ncbi:MAG: response regulator [Bryobacterales bacterium]
MSSKHDPPLEDSSRTGTVDVAVLDDDADFLHYIEDFLVDEGGFQVRTFSHPDDLYAAAEHRRPDIVLLDMKMGPFSGATVLEELQTRWPEICVIILTGYPSMEDMRATFKRKVFDYLTKPFSLGQLRQTLQNAIEAFGLGRSPADRLRDQLGRRIKLLRVEHNWPLKELAAASGVSVSQLSSIERGTHMPSVESLLALCTALDVKPSELLRSIDFETPGSCRMAACCAESSCWGPPPR